MTASRASFGKAPSAAACRRWRVASSARPRPRPDAGSVGTSSALERSRRSTRSLSPSRCQAPAFRSTATTSGTLCSTAKQRGLPHTSSGRAGSAPRSISSCSKVTKPWRTAQKTACVVPCARVCPSPSLSPILSIPTAHSSCSQHTAKSMRFPRMPYSNSTSPERRAPMFNSACTTAKFPLRMAVCISRFKRSCTASISSCVCTCSNAVPGGAPSGAPSRPLGPGAMPAASITAWMQRQTAMRVTWSVSGS
mmetsp:Transcript_89667/g.231409  ORF Transcript_89667/g.231409 Transcript_89667/m.231409 type:complete len:251 (+) Transcript_89667:116-868(+)